MRESTFYLDNRTPQPGHIQMRMKQLEEMKSKRLRKRKRKLMKRLKNIAS